MEPLQQSSIKQTVFELGICAAIVFFAGSSRLIHYFPSGSQKGLALIGGTLLASSSLYNLSRYHQERPFLQTVFEKGIVCATLSLGASMLAKRSFTVLPLEQTALLAAGFTVFTTIFQKLSSPVLAADSLKQQHAHYLNNPDAWKQLKQENQEIFINQCFEKDLPVLRLEMNGNTDALTFLTDEKKNEITKQPENFTDNQLGWFCHFAPLEINAGSASFAKVILERKIPCTDITWDDDNDHTVLEIFRPLFEKNPILEYVIQEQSVPEEMLINLFTSTSTHDFPEQVAEVHRLFPGYTLLIDESIKDKILEDVILFPRQYSRDVIAYFIHSLRNSKGKLEVTQEMLPLLKIGQELQIPLTDLKITRKLIFPRESTGASVVNHLFKDLVDLLTSQEDIPFFLSVPGMDNKPACDLKHIDDATLSKLQKILLEGTDWLDFLPPRFVLTVFNQIRKKEPETELSLPDDLTLFPEEYTEKDIACALEILKIKGVIEINEERLPLIKRALDLKVPLPPFKLDINQSSFLPKSETEKFIIALFREYPLEQFFHDGLKEILQQANPPLPTLDGLVLNLSEESIQSMSYEDLLRWGVVIGEKKPDLSPEITQVFIQRMIALDFPPLEIFNNANAIDLSWITLTEDQVANLTENQAKWYFYLCSKESPINYDETKFQDPKIERLRKIAQTIFGKHLFAECFPKTWAKKNDLNINDATFNALAKKANQLLDSALQDGDYESLFYAQCIKKMDLYSAFLKSDHLQKQLSEEDEWFLRDTLPFFFDLTERYVSLLKTNSDELAKFKERYLNVIEGTKYSHEWNRSDKALKERVLKLVNDSEASRA